MNTDSIFQIGKDHVVCQDYAMADITANVAYAIVSDGCSASPNVDVGARVLAMSAKSILLQRALNNDFTTNFGSSCIFHSNRIFELFPTLNHTALDATLLMASVINKELKCIIHGDGVYIRRGKEKTEVVHVELTSGAPDYLSYHLNKGRMEAYLNLTDNVKKVNITTIHTDGSVVVDAIEYEPFVPVFFEYTVDEGDIIAVISDGINSFQNENGNISYLDLVDEFIGFKNTVGEFEKRRINAFKRKCSKENITHSDDISIATIII
jgi:hypothetical protein